jgi:hypothetical protein
LLVDFQSLLLFFLVCHASSIAEILGPVNLIHFTKRKEPNFISFRVFISLKNYTLTTRNIS